MRTPTTGPRTWMLPLVHEQEGEEADTTRWWESDRLVLVTAIQGADMVQMCFDDRDDNREYTLDNGKKVYVLADGRLVNLAAAEGHPSEVMDMSFANQFMAHLTLIQRHESGEVLPNTVIDLPVELDQEIAGIKLETMGLRIDELSEEQVVYATDYSAGT